MSKATVAVIVGSLRKESYNKRLAKAIEKLAGDRLSFVDVRIDDLPLYNQDFDQDYPAEGTRLKKAIEGADAVLVVTPEYNRAVPGLLGNALDWGSRPQGKSSWAGKAAACIGASPGAIGTAAAQVHLKAQMVTLGMIVMGHPEFYLSFKPEDFGPDGTVVNDQTAAFMNAYADAFARHVALLSSGK